MPLIDARGVVLAGFLFVTSTLAGPTAAWAGAHPSGDGQLRLTVLFDNLPHRAGLTTGWGFSCLVTGMERSILFDTGADGAVLLSNMRRLGPGDVDGIVLSHIHADHTGGLERFLVERPDVDVWLPADFPPAFLRGIAEQGARVRPVGAGGRLFTGVYSTGPLGEGLVEQALILDTEKGLVVVTGCAHPGIVHVAETATRLAGKRIHLLVGGFHLMRESDAEIDAIVARLRALGVEKVAPSHCTGEAAIARFRQTWAEDFVAGGLGAVIRVPLR